MGERKLTDAEARHLGWIADVEKKGGVMTAFTAAMVSWAHSAGLAAMKPASRFMVQPSLTPAGRAALSSHREAQGGDRG
ncbi:hypothetical protein GAY31_19670 [Azospirillum brasilense]|nr:hypothetical protein [Azospirillum brasilense]